jgi:para-nitrobenzyl esterase
MSPLPLTVSHITETNWLKAHFKLCLFMSTIVAVHCEAAPDSAPVVTVSGGSIQGTLLAGDSGAVFKGIPFAQPPVGDLRWREPMPVIPWKGIRMAEQSGPPAKQPNQGWNYDASSVSSEDCLYLDVWTPNRVPEGHSPVMLWIHGGGNVAGAGGFDPLYDGQALISHGVILVVVEYRLGIFGFFSHPELTRESPHHASGNYGILDQIAALHWVHDNISRFGGDPGNVTVFGQSAGAMDVMALMASPLSKGLFQRAISESGPMNAGMNGSLADAEEAGANAVGKLSGSRNKDLGYLRSVSPDDLMKLEYRPRVFVADGWVFPSTPYAVWQARREHGVPLLIGANAVEFAAGGSNDEIAADIRDFFKDLAPQALALYGLGGTGGTHVDPLYGNAADQWGSDNIFRCVGIVEAGWHSAAGHACWQYQFDRARPPAPKVAHSGDLPYVFGNLKATGSMAGDYREEDHKLSAAIQAYWTNFAKAGDPNGSGLPQWTKYELGGKKYLNFTIGAEMILRDNERGPFVDLFREIMERPTALP